MFASFLFVCFLFFSYCGGSFLPEGHGSRFYVYIMANDEAPRKGPKTPSRCKIVECHMLRQFSHLFACYWELLRKVLSLSNVCASNSKHFFCV